MTKFIPFNNPYHELIWLFNLLSFMQLPSISTAPDSAASQTPSPPPSPDQFTFSPNYCQYVTIMTIVLVCAFFTFGFFSVYFRRRAGNSQGVDDGGLPIGGGRSTAARGLDSKVIETFPTFVYSYVKKGMKARISDLLECAVCLNEFEDNETLRLIPKCNHAFHLHCIDVWLSSNTTCPVCRANLDEEIPSKTGHLMSQPREPDEPDWICNRPQGQVSISVLGEMNSSGSRSPSVHNGSLGRLQGST